MKTLRLLAGLALLGAGACVDSAKVAAPSNEGDAQPLAATFDELSRQATEDGDLGRAEEFTYAALAIRNGVTPSQLTVRNSGVVEIYDALVNSISWGANVVVRPPAFRSLMAWRRGSDGLVRILSVSSVGDSVPIPNPLSMGPTASPNAVFSLARATYRETTIGRPSTPTAPEKVWLGVSGFIKLRETASGGTCGEDARPLPAGVTCVRTRYAVRLEIGFEQLNLRPFQVTAGAPRRTVVAAEQSVNGFSLRFACLTVSSRTGCG